VRGLRGLPGAWQKQPGPRKHLALRKDKQVFYLEQRYVSVQWVSAEGGATYDVCF
jgi:hypothetical protein